MGLAAATTLLVLACGLVLARGALLASRASAPWLEALAWAPATGFGLLSLVFFGWRLSGAPGAGRGSLLALMLLAVGVAAVVRGRSGSGPPAEREADEAARLLPRALRWGSRVGLAVTGLGLLLAFHRWSARWPLGTSDAINIWNARGRFLLFAREDVAELFQVMKRGHPDYPLLLPASLAAQAGFWGGWEEALPQATGAMFVLGLGLMTYVGLGTLGSGHVAAAGAALVLATPSVWRWAFAQGADLPLSYLALATGVGLASHLLPSIPRPVPPVLAGFALGLLPWTKNDGVVLAASFAGLFALFWLLHPRTSRAAWPTLLAIAAGALPGLVALALFKVFWAPAGAAGLFLRDSPADRLLDAERWSTVLSITGMTLSPFSSPWRWIAVVLALAATFLAFRSSRNGPSNQAFLPASLAVAALGYLVAYVLSPYELEWHITKSVDRLLLQLFPLAAVWALALATRSGETSPAPLPPSLRARAPARKDRAR